MTRTRVTRSALPCPSHHLAQDGGSMEGLKALTTNRGSDPRILESDERTSEGLRIAGMPAE